ncbi:hypothetical protein [Chryseobacterium vrystaatense]|nr:hypothetical protein [Chryseobacterium vrystaatense]
MEKINNFRKIKLIFRISVSLMVIILLIFAAVSLPLVLKIAFALLFTTLLFINVYVKCFEYEYAGECISIKKFHPLKSGKAVPPFVEFPKKYLKDYQLRNSLISHDLIFALDTDRRKNFKLKIKISGFEAGQISTVTDSLERIKKNNTYDR